jgi:hypothetical protein
VKLPGWSRRHEHERDLSERVDDQARDLRALDQRLDRVERQVKISRQLALRRLERGS